MMRRWLVLGLLATGSAGAAQVGAAQAVVAQASEPAVCAVIAPDATDGPVVAPANHKVVYEDADVRVIDVTVAPHSIEIMHTHARPAILYIDGDASTRMTYPDQPSRRRGVSTAAFKPVTVRLAPEGLHAQENLGDTPFHALRVELKHPGCSLAPGAYPATPDATDAVAASPKNHTVLYEDADVRVLDVHSQPHTREQVHTHAWPGIFYVIQGIPTRYFTPEMPDPPLRPAPAAGKVMYVAAEGPHWVSNEGDVAGDRLRIELKLATPKAAK